MRNQIPALKFQDLPILIQRAISSLVESDYFHEARHLYLQEIDSLGKRKSRERDNAENS
jgi:hypothetical protein